MQKMNMGKYRFMSPQSRAQVCCLFLVFVHFFFGFLSKKLFHFDLLIGFDSGHMRIVIILLENGADINAKDDDGWTSGWGFARRAREC